MSDGGCLEIKLRYASDYITVPCASDSNPPPLLSNASATPYDIGFGIFQLGPML
jgi:hypothetical protein